MFFKIKLLGVIQTSSIDGSSRLFNIRMNHIMIDEMSNDNKLNLQYNKINSYIEWNSNIQYNFTKPIQSQEILDFQNDTKILASRENQAQQQSLESNKITQVQSGHNGLVNSVINFKDLIITCSDDHTIRIFDKINPEQVRVLNGHTNSVKVIKLVPGAKLLMSGSADLTAKLWDIELGKCMYTFKGHRSAISAIAFSKNFIITQAKSLFHRVKWQKFYEIYQWIFTGSEDGTIKLWSPALSSNLNNDKDESFNFEHPIMRFIGHTDKICTLLIDSKNNLQSGSKDRTVKKWKLHGDLIFSINFDSGVSSLDSNEHENILVIGLDNGYIIIWDIKGMQEIDRYKGHDGSVTSIKYVNTIETKNDKLKLIPNTT